MKFSRFVVLGALLVAAVLATATPASAITYNFHIDAPNGYPITNLALFATDGTQVEVDLVPGALPPSGIFQLTHDVSFNPTAAMILGITERDKDDWWDIIMFTNEAYADAAVGQRYDALFPTSRNLGHNQIAPLLQAAHNGDAAALDVITSFFLGVDAQAAHFDPSGPNYAIIQFSVVEPPIGGPADGIPEPTTATLTLLSAAGLLLFRRRVHA